MQRASQAHATAQAIVTAVQAVFSGLYLGVGNGIGALLGGFIFNKFGAQAVFESASAIVITGWAVTFAAQQVIATQRTGASQDPSGLTPAAVSIQQASRAALRKPAL